MDIQQFRADYLLHKYFPSLSFSPANSEIIKTSIAIFLSIASISILVLVIRKFLSIKQFLTDDSILLELTPPAHTEKTAYTTQQLISTLHELSRSKTLMQKLSGRMQSLSFEIVSTKEEGIRYLVRTSKGNTNALKHNIMSYLPHVKVSEVMDYLPGSISKLSDKELKVVELAQTKHNAYPLQKQHNLEEHDPVAYITGNMTKLNSGEMISLHLVLTPCVLPEKEKIKSMIYRGENVLAYLDKFRVPAIFQMITVPLMILIKGVSSILSVFGGATKAIVNDFVDPRLSQRQAQMRYQMQYAMEATKMNIRPARVITPFEQKAIEAIEEKIEQKIFQAQLRLLLVMDDKNRIQEREQGFLSSFALFISENEQAFKKKIIPNVSVIQKISFFYLKKRLHSLLNIKKSMLLSVSEISDLYHFPFSEVTKTENIVKVHSKELPAPLSLKKSNNFDIEFAKNTYAGTSTMIGLTEEERRRHMYIIGATGTGKSTLLLSMINQDIQNGKGICVIDPHGELAESAIQCIPEARKRDFIYINPDDLQYPIGLNLLELTPNLSEDDELREKEYITESVISLFRKVFSDMWAAHAHRIEYILRNTIYTAFAAENPTLFTLYDLLDDPAYRKKIVAKVTDERLKKFWENEFGKAGDYQRVKMTSGITARIGRFLFSPSASRILEQEKSTINFDEILRSGKIVICNLSKGKLGEDTSEVFGIMLLAKIQLAALKRVRTPAKERQDYYVYVDEFQNFATPSFIQMLSEARKYKVNLVMAEQSTSQQKDRNFVNVIIANVGTVISFRSANPEDEKLMLPQFAPYVEKGEIANLPAFRFYIKTAALNPEESFSGETMVLSLTEDTTKLIELVQLSRDQYTKKYTPQTKGRNGYVSRTKSSNPKEAEETPLIAV